MLAPSGFLGVIAGIALLAVPASARSWAGSVDMNTACSEQQANGQGGSWAVAPEGGNAYSWYCTNQFGSRQDVDVNTYCTTTYGKNAYADPQGGGEYDWGCYYK